MANICHDCEDPVWTGKQPIKAPRLPTGENILEFDTKSDFPEVGESGFLYVDLEHNDFYKWDVEAGEYNLIGASGDSDVVDIVETYADLQAYDTDKLKDKDIVKVLVDETHDGKISYYRFNKGTTTWEFIGAQGPFYTKSETDDLLDEKQNNGRKMNEDWFTRNPSVTDYLHEFEDTASAEYEAYFSALDQIIAGTDNPLDLNVPFDTTTYAKFMRKDSGTGDYWFYLPDEATVLRVYFEETEGVDYAHFERISLSRFVTRGELAEQLEAKMDDAIISASAPTVGSVGSLGQLWLNTTDYSLYMLDNIDDTDPGNVVYEWHAVGGGGVKVLTEADYDYPEDNPTKVNIGNLPSGLYRVAAGPNLPVYMNGSGTGWSSGIYLVTNDTTYTKVFALGNGAPMMFYDAGNSYRVLTTENIQNNLTTTSSLNALDARQGKVLKDLIDSLVIKGAGAPTAATVGTVGMLYEDTTNGDLYKCSEVGTDDPITYTWEKVGGSSVNVVQTTGTSTTDVMSQDATTKMVFGDVLSRNNIEIGGRTQGYSNCVVIGKNTTATFGGDSTVVGYNAKASRGHSTSIGYGAESNSTYGTAIGKGARANANYSVALGSSSTTSIQGEVSFGGTSLGTNGYDGTRYRLLTNVHDGVSAHDAVTKGQLDTAVGNIETLMTTLISGGGAQ